MADAGRVARRGRQRDRVIDAGPVDVHIAGQRLQLGQPLGGQDRQHVGRRAQRALDDDGLFLTGRVADDDLHHEAVDLRLRQRVCLLYTSDAADE